MKLRPHQDALGQALYAPHGGGHAYELVERDDGYLDLSGGPDAYTTSYHDWADCEKRAIRLARGRVLDIGCGAGRHAIYLQERGHDVLGIDVSSLALKVARQRGLRKTRLLPITKVSRRLGTFDTILLLGNNFGLLANETRARWLLRRFKAIMPLGGRIIASSLDIYQSGDNVHRAYHRANRRRGRMGGQIRMRLRYREYATPYFDYLMVSLKEMEKIVAGTGWTISRRYEGAGPLFAVVLEREDV